MATTPGSIAGVKREEERKERQRRKASVLKSYNDALAALRAWDRDHRLTAAERAEGVQWPKAVLAERDKLVGKATGLRDESRRLHGRDAGGKVPDLPSSPPATPVARGGASVPAGETTPGVAGGGAGGPGSAGGGAPGSVGGTADLGNVEQYIAENYPQFAWLLKNPEMKQLFLDATAGDWPEGKFILELHKKEWWKQTSDTARQWEALKATDPAQSERLRAEKRNLFADQAVRLGADLDPQTLAQLVENSFLFGWTPEQNTDAIVNHVHFGAAGGLAAGALQQVKGLEHAYAFPITDPERQSWAKRLLTGEATEESLRSDAIERAKSLYDPAGTGLSKALDAGRTVRQLADGYIQIAAQDLEVDPETIDLTNPKWSRPLMQIDPKTNERVQMSLADWRQTIRADDQYGWRNTKQANEQADTMAAGLLRMFGAVA